MAKQFCWNQQGEVTFTKLKIGIHMRVALNYKVNAYGFLIEKDSASAGWQYFISSYCFHIKVVIKAVLNMQKKTWQAHAYALFNNSQKVIREAREWWNTVISPKSFNHIHWSALISHKEQKRICMEGLCVRHKSKLQLFCLARAYLMSSMQKIYFVKHFRILCQKLVWLHLLW